MLDFTSSTDNSISSLLLWMRDYANNRLNSALMDARRSIPPYIVLDFGNKGLLGLQAPVNCGGLNLSNEECMAVSTQIGAIDMNLAIFVGLHNHLGIRPIMHFSNSSVRDELLPEIASGRQLTAFGLTEPGAGSNAGAIEGQAQALTGGKVKLNGHKMWIGNAAWAGVINVFLRYVDEQGKPNGISGYVVRQGTPGLQMGPELMTMGMRGMVQNRFTMNDLVISEEHQLGALGRGLDVAQDAMMYTRLALGAIFLGGMKRCMQLMLRYAERRMKISTGRLLDHPVSMMHLSTLTAQSDALEALVLFISRGLDKSISIPEEFLITAKVLGSEFLWEAADKASQMLGGRGYLESNEITKILRDARVGRVFEGPTETMMYYMGSRFTLSGDELISFLCTELNAQDVADQLMEVMEQVKSRCTELAAPYSGMRKRNLSNSLLGEIITWGILYATARNTEKASDQSRIIFWTEEKFKTSIRSATSISLAESISLDPSELQSIISQYENQIGDMEQTLPGEEWSTDPYLSRHYAG